MLCLPVNEAAIQNDTLSLYLFKIAGKLEQNSRRFSLKLSITHAFQNSFYQLLERIQQLCWKLYKWIFKKIIFKCFVRPKSSSSSLIFALTFSPTLTYFHPLMDKEVWIILNLLIMKRFRSTDYNLDCTNSPKFKLY